MASRKGGAEPDPRRAVTVQQAPGVEIVVEKVGGGLSVELTPPGGRPLSCWLSSEQVESLCNTARAALRAKVFRAAVQLPAGG